MSSTSTTAPQPPPSTTSTTIPNMASNLSNIDPKKNVIVIEDSPSASASIPAQAVLVPHHAPSDNESKEIVKKSRKRKHPSISGHDMNMNGGVGSASDDSDKP